MKLTTILGVLLIILLLLVPITTFSQNIEIKDETAYVDGISYLKLDEFKKNNYIIRDIRDDNRLLKIELVKAYNRIDKETHHLPQVYCYKSRRKTKYEVNIHTQVELINFIYSKKLVPLKKYKKD